MTPAERTKQALVQGWLEKAEEDLAVAEYLVSSDRPYFGAVGFHAQQGAEKYFKALLQESTGISIHEQPRGDLEPLAEPSHVVHGQGTLAAQNLRPHAGMNVQQPG